MTFGFAYISLTSLSVSQLQQSHHSCQAKLTCTLTQILFSTCHALADGDRESNFRLTVLGDAGHVVYCDKITHRLHTTTHLYQHIVTLGDEILAIFTFQQTVWLMSQWLGLMKREVPHNSLLNENKFHKRVPDNVYVHRWSLFNIHVSNYEASSC